MLSLLIIILYIMSLNFRLLRLCGFNPLTPLDLSHLPMFEHVNLDDKKKVEFVKQIHEKARLNVERMTEQYAKQANKGCRQVVFEPGDWVWVHIRKEKFLA